MEAVKEKQQHIEQVLKDRNFDRTKFAQLVNQLEELSKEETSRLENVIKSKDEEIRFKQAEISKLLQEIEGNKKWIESAQKEIVSHMTDQKRMSDANEALNRKLVDLEEKYTKLLEEKDKIAKEELQTRDTKKNLEVLCGSLLKEKSAQEEIIKDRETKLEALQAEVDRIKIQFAQHKIELQRKIDVNQMEIEAGIELKNQSEIQHGAIEELQQERQVSGKKRKKLEAAITSVPAITSDKNKTNLKNRPKLVFCINKSLKLNRGKLAAEVSHAAIDAAVASGLTASEVRTFLLKIEDEDAIDTLLKKAKEENVMTVTSKNKTRNKFPAGCTFVLGIGPGPEEKINALTSHLKLL